MDKKKKKKQKSFAKNDGVNPLNYIDPIFHARLKKCGQI